MCVISLQSKGFSFYFYRSNTECSCLNRSLSIPVLPAWICHETEKKVVWKRSVFGRYFSYTWFSTYSYMSKNPPKTCPYPNTTTKVKYEISHHLTNSTMLAIHKEYFYENFNTRPYMRPPLINQVLPAPFEFPRADDIPRLWQCLPSPFIHQYSFWQRTTLIERGKPFSFIFYLLRTAIPV